MCKQPRLQTARALFAFRSPYKIQKNAPIGKFFSKKFERSSKNTEEHKKLKINFTT